MRNLKELEEAARAAVSEEFEAARAGKLSRSIMCRRDAAIAEWHEALDPWQPCRCGTCKQHRGTSRANS